ncbi:hypothetical protein GCM10009821_23370 [Aeromicrobium halocynthiae]|uniref:Recombinase XerD n=1 Tax=Aeromicrobium halocynthiae TaxID=560557 RepID=A0ABN2W2H1_9ACTN
MAVRKEKSGRWRAVLKNGRTYVAGRTFDTKREAEAWLARERASLVGGVDPRAGKITVKNAFADYMELRRHTVATTTYRSEAGLIRILPPALANLHVAGASDREVQRALDAWSKSYAESSVKRFRAQLSGFFAWAVRERLRIGNPVARTHVPRQSQADVGMQPFTESELREVRAEVARFDEHLADVVWFLGWTGLRWSEVRELRVADVVEVPMPRILVRRATPEVAETKSTKSGRHRHVPLSNELLSLVRSMAQGKGPNDLLVTSTGGARLHATYFKRTTRWSSAGRGRRLHDLRHTAACLWLAAGVPVSTVQAWLGHSSLQTTQIYVHYLGDTADQVGLDALNRQRHAGSTSPGVADGQKP